MNHTDTIAAISSAVGMAARIIVRLSGPESVQIASALTGDLADLPTGAASYCSAHLAGIQLPCWLYLFRAPHSYTGQECVELHIPGNPLAARMLLEESVRRGARLAE